MPAPYSTPPDSATTLGPDRPIQIPPPNVANPTTKIAIVKVSVTSEIDQPNSSISGVLNTLQA
jgi:hypothetical protein